MKTREPYDSSQGAIQRRGVLLDRFHNETAIDSHERTALALEYLVEAVTDLTVEVASVVDIIAAST